MGENCSRFYYIKKAKPLKNDSIISINKTLYEINKKQILGKGHYGNVFLEKILLIIMLQ